MASNYTCRVCLRAVRQKSSSITTAAREYHFQTSSKPEYALPIQPQRSVTRWANRSTRCGTYLSHRSYASSGINPDTVPQSDTVTISNSEDVGSAELMARIRELHAQGKRVGVTDKEGVLHVLATIPDDVRTYNWKTPEWTWGVLERLFQDCEQAKIRFELEEYVDEDSGRKKKRVKSDKEGLHVGKAEGWWFDTLQLPKTFNSWAVVSMLHMWMLKVRIRHLPKQMSDHWNELLTNHFFWEAEKTMDFVHKIDPVERKKYLEQYADVWRGTVLAYDEGMIRGDAALAAAIWRQIFNADEDIDPIKVALVTAYVRREVARVGALSDKVIAQGYVGFGQPVNESDILIQSPLMRLPFGEGSKTSANS